VPIFWLQDVIASTARIVPTPLLRRTDLFSQELAARWQRRGPLDYNGRVGLAKRRFDAKQRPVARPHSRRKLAPEKTRVDRRRIEGRQG
jgi:hypothetical protein